MSAQVAQDLRAAAEVLRRDGWTTGLYFNPDTGCRCGVGAILEALEPGAGRLGELSTEGIGRLIAAENAVALRVEAPILDWNDTPGRTADEVIAALEAAADAAEAQQ